MIRYYMFRFVIFPAEMWPRFWAYALGIGMVSGFMNEGGEFEEDT